jgi:bromodomain and PHD finger-containing protein 1
LQENVVEDVKCQVCTDGDYTDDNLIVFCATCNISVHQRCVNLAKVPA